MTDRTAREARSERLRTLANETGKMIAEGAERRAAELGDAVRSAQAEAPVAAQQAVSRIMED